MQFDLMVKNSNDQATAFCDSPGLNALALAIIALKICFNGNSHHVSRFWYDHSIDIIPLTATPMKKF